MPQHVCVVRLHISIYLSIWRMEFRIVPANRVQVYLLFYRPKADDPLLNRLVAFFDGPFSHVEMAFSDKWGEEPWERELWGSSIYQGETVFFQPKSYSRDGYFSLSIEITLPQMYRLRSFCRHQAENKVGFSKRAMYASYIPYYQFIETSDTFCSKHVTSALQYGGVAQVHGLNPSLMTPSKLYKIITSASAPQTIVQILPSKMLADNTNSHCTAKMVREILI